MSSGLRYNSFHVSSGIGFVCLGLLIGISLAQVFQGQRTGNLVLIPLCIIVLLLCIRIRVVTILLIVSIAIIIGYFHATNVDITLRDLESYSGKEIIFTGLVEEDPQKTAKGDIRMVISNITIREKAYAGSIWITVEKGEYSRGDIVTVKDKMKQGFGTYQLSATYAEVLQQQRTVDPLIAIRDQFATSLRSVVVEPAASLGIGFVIGQKSALPPELDDQLRAVGLTHLVVASGYNLTILMRFAKRLFERHSKFIVLASSASLVITFIALSGASPSMIRAGLVAGLSLMAWAYGRRYHPLILILLVAAITAMANPLYVWADIGWWLSFTAFFGVLVLSPLILRMLYKRADSPTLVQLISETVAAQIVTLPLILFVFGSLPALAIFANIVTAPLIPLAMLLTATAGITSMVFPLLAPIISFPAEILLSYVVAVVRGLSYPSWSMVDISVSVALVVIIYTFILAATGIIWKKTNYNFRSHSIID